MQAFNAFITGTRLPLCLCPEYNIPGIFYGPPFFLQRFSPIEFKFLFRFTATFR
jgi:hypothetical protein